MVTAAVTRARREPLTRQRVLSAALGYLDENGLAELSMHKLGAQLGVSGMSLYNHVADKDALLDGIVELLWDELAAAQPASGDWRQILRELGLSLRLLAHRHPRAVTLLLTRPVLSVPMLRVYQRALQAMADGGLPQPRALEVLRTVVGYTFGYALTELSALCATAGETQLQRVRHGRTLRHRPRPHPERPRTRPRPRLVIFASGLPGVPVGDLLGRAPHRRPEVPAGVVGHRYQPDLEDAAGNAEQRGGLVFVRQMHGGEHCAQPPGAQGELKAPDGGKDRAEHGSHLEDARLRRRSAHAGDHMHVHVLEPVREMDPGVDDPHCRVRCPPRGQCQPEDAAVRLGDACLTGQHHGAGQTGHAVGRQPGPGMRPGAGDDGGPRPALDPAEAGQELLVPPPPRRDVSRPSAERRRLMLSRRRTCRHQSSSLIWPVRTGAVAHADAVPGQRPVSGTPPRSSRTGRVISATGGTEAAAGPMRPGPAGHRRRRGPRGSRARRTPGPA